MRGKSRNVVLFTLISVALLSGSFLYNGILGENNIKSVLLNLRHRISNTDLDYGSDDLVYHPPANTSMHGAYFNEVNKTILSNLLPLPVSMNRANIDDFIFVTAISDKYYPRSTLLVESIQTHLPSIKLIIYDIGLTATQSKTMQKWCNVTVRRFDFKKYPPHVKNLFCYAFKPIAIAETLKEYKGSGVFWVDTSVRFRNSDISDIQRVARDAAYATLVGFSIFSCMPPEMFKFLPLVKDSKKISQYESGVVLLYKTKSVIDNILRWWVACALSRSCIFSYPSRFCKFHKDSWNHFASCSRYDQSALSILMHNAFPGMAIAKTPIEIYRGGSNGKIKSC